MKTQSTSTVKKGQSKRFGIKFIVSDVFIRDNFGTKGRVTIIKNGKIKFADSGVKETRIKIIRLVIRGIRKEAITLIAREGIDRILGTTEEGNQVASRCCIEKKAV